MSKPLFETLAGMQAKPIPAFLQPGTRVLLPGRGVQTIPAPNTEPLKFEIVPVTSNQLITANAVLDAVTPPELHDENKLPGSMGVTRTHAGYDHENPEYLAKLAKLRPKRNALLCLFGCPALRDSTPGTTLEEKAEKLAESVPAFVLIWLAGELEEMAFLAGVGEDKVAAFFPEGSAASPSSGSSSGRSRTKKRRQP